MPSYNNQYPDRNGRQRPSGSRPYDTRSDAHSGQRRQGQGQRQGQRSRRPRSQQDRPLNSRGPRPNQQPYKSHRNYRTINGTDTGYNLRQSNINFSGKRRRGRPSITEDPRSLLLLAGAIIVLILLVVGISSCVRGCSKQRESSEGSAGNSLDARVAAGASSEITAALTPALDKADGLDKIAANADAYTDPRMIALAVSEPEAISFVANYPGSDKTSSGYSDEVAKGTYPQLFDWDSRWGNVDYADGALGVTGSGPTVVAMAYMGLTGKNDQTPATIATTATDAGYASGDADTDKAFFASGLTSLGLTATEYTVSADNITSMLQDGTPIAVLVKADTLTHYAHWILVVGTGEDGALVVYDPTSASVSSHTWSASTIGFDGDVMYTLAAADSGDGSDSTDAEGSDSTAASDSDSDSSDSSDSSDNSDSSSSSDSSDYSDSDSSDSSDSSY